MARLPRSIIAKYGISKRAWQVFRGKRTRSSKPTGGIRRRMARRWRRGRHRSRRKFTVPIAPIAGLYAGFLAKPVELAMAGNVWGGGGAIDELVSRATLHDRNGFRQDFIWSVYAPLIAGLLIHKFVGGAPLNLNRTLASSGVPIIRI